MRRNFISYSIITLLSAAIFVSFPSAAQIQPSPAPVADTNLVIDNTPDSIAKARTARPVPGSSRKGNNPVLFLIGNSTMRTGTLGNGNNGQWGWGYFLPDYFDESRITIENHALGGMSSRTFYNRLWPEVLTGISKGDWVWIELGHNDNGPYDSGRARASIPGIGRDSLSVIIKETSEPQTVFSYGEYMRKYVDDVRAKGAYPVLMSLTPRNRWIDSDSTLIERVDSTYGAWARAIAKEKDVPFIDLNRISADKFEKYGKDKVKTLFYLDNIHSSEFGARANAQSAVEGITQSLPQLAQYVIHPSSEIDQKRQEGKSMIFIIGDSTVTNEDSSSDSMWGWGSVLAEYVDSTQAVVDNHAVPGRSARTFLDEGRWDSIYESLRPGDVVLIQFGHNDAGPIDSGRERAELPGTGNESKVFRMQSSGNYKVVYTYGWYLRKYIMDCFEKGAVPVVISHTPRNKFDNGLIESNSQSFGLWTREVARQMGVTFVDLNALSGQMLQKIADETGLLEVNSYFKNDHSHSSLKGAHLNARNLVEALKESSAEFRSLFKAD